MTMLPIYNIIALPGAKLWLQTNLYKELTDKTPVVGERVTLLAQKEAECRQKGITLECMVDFSKADFIRYADIVTLFSNMLDNAMEAVLALPAEQRSITVSAGAIGGQIIVKCINPYQGMLRKRQDGLFSTSKQNTALHGIGLSNLKRVIESYQGVLRIDDQGGVFQVEWMIPVPVAG